jgi:ribosomal protein S16
MYKIRLKKIGNVKKSHFLITGIDHERANSSGIYYPIGYFNSKENLGNVKLTKMVHYINNGVYVSNRVAKFLYKLIKQYNK